MTDPLLAHVRFLDHAARCPECTGTMWTGALCDTGRELLTAWQRAEEVSTKQAEEYDVACAEEAGMAWRNDATGAA